MCEYKKGKSIQKKVNENVTCRTLFLSSGSKPRRLFSMSPFCIDVEVRQVSIYHFSQEIDVNIA